MTVVGTTVRYVTVDGKQVQAVVCEEKWNLPHFSVEVVDAGEVVEHLTVLGAQVLRFMAEQRHWTEMR